MCIRDRYDLERDPYELDNLINNPAAASALTSMKAELERLLEASS